MKTPIAIVALASCLTAACRTASPPAVPASLLACGKVQDPDARVRCYDTQVAAMNRSATAAPASASAAPASASAAPNVSTPAPAPATPAASTAAAPAPAATAEPAAESAQAQPAAPSSRTATSQRALTAEFGIEQLPPSARPPDPRMKEVLHSSITGIQQASPNNFVLSLSNGQAWVENDAELTRLFHIGDDVQIERGVLGGYHLSTHSIGAKNWVLVTRVR